MERREILPPYARALGQRNSYCQSWLPWARKKGWVSWYTVAWSNDVCFVRLLVHGSMGSEESFQITLLKAFWFDLHIAWNLDVYLLPTVDKNLIEMKRIHLDDLDIQTSWSMRWGYPQQWLFLLRDLPYLNSVKLNHSIYFFWNYKICKPWLCASKMILGNLCKVVYLAWVPSLSGL